RESQPNDPPDLQPHYRRQFVMHLAHAAAHFQKLVDDLQARQAAAPLPQGEAALLRQALFGLADCRFDLTSYAEAVPLYIRLANQHPPQVDSLLALRRLSRCYKMMDKPEISLLLHSLGEM